MADTSIVIYRQYLPTGVKRVIASGTSAFVGEIDDDTVLKYPLAPGETERLEVEKKLLEVVCPHPRIIQLRRYSDTGLYLERGQNGTVAEYLLNSGKPPPSVQQRLMWCREAAEAVSYIHLKRVLHCDIQQRNLLLDAELHIKLSDFQGRLLSADGEVLLDGWSGEPCRFFAPRDDHFNADVKTDIFALGCTIYFIMHGHAVFPDIIDGENGWRDKVRERFAKQQFSQESYAWSPIAMKCWLRQYGSAEEVTRDIVPLKNSVLTVAIDPID